MRRALRWSVIAVVLSLSAASLSAQPFVFGLRGDQEVPPVGTTDSGGCFAQLDQLNAKVDITCVHNVTGATLMHFHRGAPGVNGPIVFDLGNPTSPVVATWSGMTPADIADFLAGNLYINVHTAGRPAGEIRGQVLPRTVDVVTFTADGAQVVPPNGTSATANCTADLDNPAASLAINCTHNVPGATDAHVHEAPAGVNGPIVFTFSSPASPLSANVPMTAQMVADYAATFLYLDIHTPPGTESSPNAEVRGQIGTPPAAPATGTIRIVKASSPAGGSGFAFTDNIPGGPAGFTLNDGGTQTFSSVAAGTYTVTESAASGWTLDDVSCSDADSSGNPFARTATVSLQAGESVTCTFRNLHTITSPALFVFRIEASQEVPPNGSTGRGGCMAEFDGASTLAIVCTHDLIGASQMHIHRGAPGVNGPVIFDFGNPTSPVQATWSSMTPANVADLLGGNLYVNIHTGGRPAGEARGQIVPRSIDTVAFPLDASQEVPPTTSTATGACAADLSNDATSLDLQCTHNVVAPTAMHLHDGFPGEEGPVVFNLPTASPSSSNVPLTPRLVADFEAGFLYVNIHSSSFPEGEIRGQMFGPAIVNTIPIMQWWMTVLLLFSVIAIAWWRLR